MHLQGLAVTLTVTPALREGKKFTVALGNKAPKSKQPTIY